MFMDEKLHQNKFNVLDSLQIFRLRNDASDVMMPLVQGSTSLIYLSCISKPRLKARNWKLGQEFQAKLIETRIDSEGQ